MREARDKSDAPDTAKPPDGGPGAVSLVQRCASIDLLILDVDGVLTDGGIVYGSDGVELKQFHVRDGSGLKFWAKAGKRAALLEAPRGDQSRRRCGEDEAASRGWSGPCRAPERRRAALRPAGRRMR